MQYKPTKLGKLTWSLHEKRFYIYDGSNWIPLDDNGRNPMIEDRNTQESINEISKKSSSNFMSNIVTATIWGIVTLVSIFMICATLEYGFDKIQTLPQQEVEIRKPN